MRQGIAGARGKSTAAQSRVALIGGLVLCGGAILAAWLVRGNRAVDEDSRVGSSAAFPQSSVSPPRASPTIDDSGANPSRSAESALPAPVAQPVDGRGTIRGEVVAQGGVRFPQRWTLIVEPNPWLAGRERAVHRRVEFVGGETRFRVENLPLAGYLVRAHAPGLNSLPVSVLLVPGSEHPFVTTALLPSGFIDGSVLAHDGRPAEGLDVTLESVLSRERRTVTTDAAGAFLFNDVVDAEYRLCLGRPDSPLLPAESLAFVAPSMRFPTRTLPPTGRIRILACDPQSRALPRTEIKGFSGAGGAFDAIADDEGRVDARHLPAGRYRIDARAADGRTGDVTVELAAGQVVDAAVVIRR